MTGYVKKWIGECVGVVGSIVAQVGHDTLPRGIRRHLAAKRFSTFAAISHLGWNACWTLPV